MSLLGLLYRLKGENNINGVDVEFQRNKNLILQELQIRKEEYEANPKDDANKVLYFKMKEMVDKLKIAEATSYEQVSQNASPRNAKAIEKLAKGLSKQKDVANALKRANEENSKELQKDRTDNYKDKNQKDLEEKFTVQITKKDGTTMELGRYNTAAEAQRFVDMYGKGAKVKKEEVELEEKKLLEMKKAKDLLYNTIVQDEQTSKKRKKA